MQAVPSTGIQPLLMPSGVPTSRSKADSPSVVLANAADTSGGNQPNMNKSLQELYMSIDSSISNLLSTVTRTKQTVRLAALPFPSCEEA